MNKKQKPIEEPQWDKLKRIFALGIGWVKTDEYNKIILLKHKINGIVKITDRYGAETFFNERHIVAYEYF